MPLDIHSWPIYLLNPMGCQSIMPFSSWMCTFVTLRGCRAWLPSSIMKAIYFDNFLSPQKLSDIQYAANWAPNFPRPSRLMLRYRSGNQSQGHKAKTASCAFPTTAKSSELNQFFIWIFDQCPFLSLPATFNMFL